MDGPGFPLLDLPDTALINVFNFMSPLELWTVANGNPRCEKLAKHIKFDITASDANHIAIWVHYAPQQKAFYKFGSSTTSEEEWRSTVSSVAKFLKQSLKKLYFYTEDFETNWAWILSDQRDVEVLGLTVKNVEDPQKVINTILKNGDLKRLERLVLNLEVPESFKYSDPLIFDNPKFILRVNNPSWLTVQNIAECHVKVIDVETSTFRDEDLNCLLRNFLKEEIRNKGFELSRVVRVGNSGEQKIDIDVVFDGLRDEIRYQRTYPDLGDVYCFWMDDNSQLFVLIDEYSLKITFLCEEGTNSHD